MDSHLIIYAALWLLTVIMSWLPFVSKKIKISYPIFLLIFGFIIFKAWVPIPWPDPYWPNSWVMYISEIIVIVSLMWSGLKIGRNYSFENWKIILRLIVISMPLFLVGVFFFWYIFLWFSLPAAVLLAAVLSPTDPVLASEVQIEKLSENTSISSKFALTWEAGINDGLAFPFTILAVSLATALPQENNILIHWFFDTFLLKISMWILFWYLFGKLFWWAIHKIPKISWIWNPFWFIILSITFLVYAGTELLHGYWFLAVFVCAVVLRHSEEIQSDMKYSMHDFIEQMEKLLLVLWLLIFWWSIFNGILDNLVLIDYIFVLFLIFILRPITSLFWLFWSGEAYNERFLISFFGIRGIWSIFYLSWAFVEYPNFPMQEKLYSIVCLAVLCSILVHGLTAPYFVSKVEKNIY